MLIMNAKSYKMKSKLRKNKKTLRSHGKREEKKRSRLARARGKRH